MTMRRWILFGALFSILFWNVSSPVAAQFYIGIQAGLSQEKPSLEGIKFNRDSSFLYGAQVGLKFLFLRVEGQYYRAAHTLMYEDNIHVVPSVPINGRGLDYSFLGVEVKAGLSFHILYPYLSVAYGSYLAKIADFGDNSKSGFNVGAGLELDLGKISLFAEGKYLDFSPDIDNLKFDFGGFNLHLGLNYHF
jgi:opacity protein-like surface antigen